MKTLLSVIAACVFGAAVQSDAREIIHKGDIVVAPLHGEIAPSLFLFIRRAEKAAETAGASAIIFEIDTYGGRLDTAEQLTSVINRATIPTYSYINTNAGSAGALVAIATQHIYMAPVSAMGAAAPVLSSGQDLPTTEREKTVSYWSALVRGSAIKNGHNPDLAEAFMNKDKEVKIGDRVVHPKGSLLSLNAQEATEKINGKPLLADGIADSLVDLTRKAGLKGEIVSIEPTGFERLAFLLTAIAPLLLLGGIVGAYLEFKIPGATLPGVIAGVCFALFFLGHYFAGLAGWEVAGLFVLGLVLVIIEIIFFAHSTIIVGVLGIFCMLGALLWAMIDRYPGEPLFPTVNMLALPIRNLFIAVAASIAVIALLARCLPRTSFYRRFALLATNPPGPSLATAARHFETAVELLPGAAGRTTSILRPSGKARFGDHIVDVVTEGEFVPAEAAVSVVQIDGVRVVVRATAPVASR